MLWTEAAFSACLAGHWPDHHWQCNWRVAWTSLRMNAGKKRTLRATICDNIHYSAIWQETFLFLSNMTRFLACFFRKLPQFHTSNFRKVVRQHIEGMVGSVIWVLLEIYLAFQQWKYFKNPLRIDKVIAMSLLYYFFGHSVGYITPHCTRYMRMSISDDENTPVIHCWLNSAGLPMRRHMVYTYYYYSRFFYPPFTR